MQIIKLNDVEYTVRLDLRALRDFEQRTKKRLLGLVLSTISAITDAFRPDSPNPERLAQALDLTADDVATLIWALIGGKESKLSVDDVAKAVDLSTAREIFAVITDAIIDSFPELGQAAGSRAPAGGDVADPPAGASSGQSR